MKNDAGKRIYELRNYLGLSQEAFGDKLGITRSAVSRIEKGWNDLTEKNIMLLTRQFGVNKEWLLEGKGEMFRDELNEEELISMLDIADPLDLKIIRAYLRLDEKYKAAVWQLVKNLICAVT